MLKEDERALGVFERKVLRTIYGGVRTVNGEWRRRMNHELHALLGGPTIVQEVEVGRLRWPGHVARMHDDSPVKMIFDRDQLEGGRGRKPGEQRARWGDQARRNIRKICNLEDWRQTAQDREIWRRLLVTARASLRALC
ncbi:conserved hypothetical protein [Culex quinquefasciatus]|uniref:Uncharacterized protein n=1 Tax=Culex quinquefasciatus TaxID=7176 RepID=B0X3X7_CULQU|nr:conserved hypothetical protein [Culex quinquefasciatus]|eukprot:XP_001864349.1 conserved hypothetical protein [Culex quinquefasciatus]